MFSFLNPFLLWGLIALAAPILIHLLLRQKPKTRPWAAMRWLQAAVHAAQRRYKITNLLLLLLRCLLILLLVLAVARPFWGLWSRGGDLVILIDISASMSTDGNGHGALQQASEQLRAHLHEQGLSQDRVCVISVGQETRVISNSDAASALDALQQLDSDYLPGGLERALEKSSLATIAAELRPYSTLLCISDFRQDDGAALQKTLAPSVHQITRWQVGSAQAQVNNAAVRSIPTLPDFVAGQAQQFQVMLSGQAENIAQLHIDGGNPSPLKIQEPLQIAVPPLAAGKHQLQFNFKDAGLAYDNQVQVEIAVRGAVACLVVQQQFGYIAAVVDAARQQLAYRHIDPARLHSEPLPENGVVILDSPISDSKRILNWVNEGGVLMLWSDALASHNDVAAATAISVDPKNTHSGAISSDDRLLTRMLAHLPFTDTQCLSLNTATDSDQDVNKAKMLDNSAGEQAEALLNIDGHAVAARCRVGTGYVIVCSASLRGNDQFWAQGSAPYWLRTLLRQSTALAQQALIIHAGTALRAPLKLRLADLSEHSFAAGELLMLRPGLATDLRSKRRLIILPNQAESQLALPRHDDVVRDLDTALPQSGGSDWSFFLLIILILLALSEGLFAGKIGRTYSKNDAPDDLNGKDKQGKNILKKFGLGFGFAARARNNHGQS